jgi:hypothetical protein
MVRQPHRASVAHASCNLGMMSVASHIIFAPHSKSHFSRSLDRVGFAGLVPSADFRNCERGLPPAIDSLTRRRSIALGGTDAAMRSDEAVMTAVTQTRSDVAALKKALMLIGGKWVESASGEVLEVEDPAHRRPVAEIPRGRVEDVARAVNAAAEAFGVATANRIALATECQPKISLSWSRKPARRH